MAKIASNDKFPTSFTFSFKGKPKLYAILQKKFTEMNKDRIDPLSASSLLLDLIERGLKA